MKTTLLYSLLPVILVLQLNELQGQQFSNVAEALGVVHSMNSEDGFGGGVSFCDFDQDGWDDITLVNDNDSLFFFRNLGGQFERVYYAGMFSGKVRQALWVDFDNDGHLDFFVSRDGSSCFLFRNNGDMTFEDVTIQAGLAGLNTRNYGASFADYNKDGFLDFYLARYLIFGDVNNEQHVNALFKNNGDGTFTNVAFEAGVSNGSQLSFMGGWMDYNNDGWPDLMVINDKLANHNHLYRNNGDGTFTDVTDSTGAHMPLTDAMSATFADFDNDGDLDFFSTSTHHLSTHPKLLVNQSGEFFTEEATERGLNFNRWSWGATFLDADNDSNLDMYIATGWTTNHWNPEEASALFMNNGDHVFNNQTNGSFAQSTVAASYGVAAGDLDNDGYADILSLNADNYNSFLWKNTGGDQHYVKVTLQGVVSNNMAVGSWISVYAGGQRWVHYTRCGENYCSQNSQHHIFGLAQAQEIDSISIQYPSGHVDNYYNLAVNQHYHFTEGETYAVAISGEEVITICIADTAWLSADAHHSCLWNTGDTTQSIVVSESGMYHLTAWNEFGLPAYSDTVEVVVLPEAEVQFDVQHVSCAGAENGAVAVHVSSGPVSEIVWNTGDTDTLLAQLGPGIYSFNALDSASCAVSGEVSINEPAPLATQAITTEALCYGEPSGTAQLNIIGGTPPYSTDWNGWDPQHLLAGNYTVLVADENGCENPVAFTIHQPDSLWLGFDLIPSSGGSDSEVSAVIEGGTPPYNLYWSTGDMDVWQLTNLMPGTYILQVTDAQDCMAENGFVIDQVSTIQHVFEHGLKVFPNPSGGTVVLNGCVAGANIELCDMYGRLAYSQRAISCPALLSLSHLPAGQYVLRVQQGTHAASLRLVLTNAF